MSTGIAGCSSNWPYVIALLSLCLKNKNHFLIIFLQQLHASDKEYSVASELLALGVESTEETNATYLKVLFLLSRAMILLIDRKMNDVLAIFHQASIVIENSIQNLHLKEYLKVFYLVLQVNFKLEHNQSFCVLIYVILSTIAFWFLLIRYAITWHWVK